METEYKMTEKQIEDFEHIQSMVNDNAENLRFLCNQERSDIEYGFEIGNIYSHLKKLYTEMDNLITSIYQQPLIP